MKLKDIKECEWYWHNWPTKKMAQALIKWKKHITTTPGLYESEEDVKKDIGLEWEVIQFPYTVNGVEQWVEVPE